MWRQNFETKIGFPFQESAAFVKNMQAKALVLFLTYSDL